MKKINDLKQERSEVITRMEEITKTENLTEEQRSAWTESDNRIKAIDEEIALLERQENLNKTNITKMENTQETPKSIGVQFRDWMKDAVEKGVNTSFRADPIITSTDANMIVKNVANGIDVLTSPGEAFLRQLGVTFFTGLNGNFAVPSMDQDTATFPGEDVSTASAGMAPASLVLAARRVTHSQSITKETLAQTTPGVYTSIYQNLINGIWNAVTNDVFDTLESDGTGRQTVTGTTLTYTNLVDMEASIGGLNIGAGAYVTTPSGKAFMKKTIALGTTAGPAIWTDDNQVNGYPAYGVPAANANHTYFGDFSKQAVGQWGGIEVIVDPYSQAAQGRIVLTAVGLFDTGCMNKRAFAILDASFA